MSIYLNKTGDVKCESQLGFFASILTQYSLFASESFYFFLAVDGLISVIRPFSDPQSRYKTYVYCVFLWI